MTYVSEAENACAHFERKAVLMYKLPVFNFRETLNAIFKVNISDRGYRACVSQAINIWLFPNKCKGFLLNFLSCGMLNAWCAKLVLKTYRLNFHGRNQSILKEVFLMACRHGEIFVQYDLYKITETD